MVIAVGLLCAAVIVIEVGAVTNFFGLEDHHASGSTGPTGPGLNPYGEMMISVTGEIVYTGSGSNYFPGLEHSTLCGRCSELPNEYSQDIPPEVGFYFFFNVTNEQTTGKESISQPVLTTVPHSTIFTLVTFCCYSALNTPYSESLTDGLTFPANTTWGLEGYIYTTVTIPSTSSGGYEFYYNVTSG